jgi:hypothetical protein
MTKQNIVRIFAGLSFLIFFCPFFQMCSESSRLKKTLAEQSVEQSEIIKEKARQERDSIEFSEKVTFSGYRMGTYIFEPESLKNMEADDLLDSTFHACLLFTLTLILSIILFILSLKKKFNGVYKLALLNLLFAIVPILIFYSNGVLEEITQIKFGYYLFIFNTVALIIFSRKLKIPSAA